MCITAERLAWLKEIRSRGYDVIWVDALFAIESEEQSDG
jgi:hypothetical protein